MRGDATHRGVFVRTGRGTGVKDEVKASVMTILRGLTLAGSCQGKVETAEIK